ncbi:hypothetical protein Y000_03745 [Staphylococcus aureus MUF168]|nr:hypothetical protein Y000_03745 [Staphylococcus aureus MUF168]
MRFKAPRWSNANAEMIPSLLLSCSIDAIFLIRF